MKKQNKLIIHCITYNHARFIRQALDGFVMQKTNFPFQAYVADDCSTDGTQEIIKEYAEKYPDIIVPVLRNRNIGAIENFIDLSDRIKSEYVALCEGDDFWTDKNKLQKQVDYLDTHTKCSICFHPVKVFFEDDSQPDSIFPDPNWRFNRYVLDLSDLLKHNFIQTNSAVYRWRFRDENIHDIFPTNIIPGDYFMHLLHAQKGTIDYIDEVMATYRKHAGGMWFDGCTSLEKLHLKYGISEIHFNLTVEEHIALDKSTYHEKTTLTNAEYFKSNYIKHHEYEKAAEIIRLCPDVLAERASTIVNDKRKIKITLFGLIPLLKLQKIRTNKSWVKLFGFIPLLKIKG